MFAAAMLAVSAAGMPLRADGGAAAAPASSRDMHTFARPDEARVTAVALDLTADFTSRTLAGTATLDLTVSPGVREVVLDTSDLTIESVTAPDGRPLRFELGRSDPILGRPLRVELHGDVRSIVVRYRTSPDARALQWLTPEQTAGGAQPYLFSQGEAILTRSWIPTQDSPGIRQTYRARIVVPKPLTAVMSAEMLTPQGVEAPGGRAFSFKLDQPVPPYLIALAVGDIAFRPIGPRTGVFAEPAVVDKAAYEFGDLEKMVEAAESLYGPYRWGRYDILVLPPSFPFGGMENPRLTFVTPTVLAGDRSLTSLAAHELAHSWSGNLVTNATWRDFWLNEGFTTYFENRIMERLYGPALARMLEQIGRTGLLEEIERLRDKPGDTILYIDLTGRDPDDGATVVPYDKGAAFLRLLEQTVGRDAFDAWLRTYFDKFAFQSMTTAGFLEYLRSTLIGTDGQQEAALEVHKWLFEPGLPDNAPAIHSDAFAKVEAQARAFAAGTPAGSLAIPQPSRTDAASGGTAGKAPAQDWSTQEWQHFLSSLPATLDAAQLADLDRQFGFTATGNSEVLFGWLRIAIRNKYEPALPALERFLTTQGRRKFVKPLFEDLVKTDWGRPVAERIYAKARPMYHPVTVRSIDEVMGRER
jgi:aminopeptidase N